MESGLRVESNLDPPWVETNAPEIHVDGVHRVEVAGDIMKFVLFSLRCSPSGELERREAATIAMPVSAFPGGVDAARECFGAVVHTKPPVIPFRRR